MNPSLSKTQLFSASKASFKNTILILIGGLAAGLSCPLNYLWLIIIGEVILALLFLVSFVGNLAEFSVAKRYYNLILNDPTLTTYELALKLKTVDSNGKETEEELKDSAKDEECDIRQFMIKCEQKGFLLPGVYFDLDAGRLVFPIRQATAASQTAYRDSSGPDYSDHINRNADTASSYRNGAAPVPDASAKSAAPAPEPQFQNEGVIYCGQCGAKNNGTNKFCSRCGSALDKQ